MENKDYVVAIDLGSSNVVVAVGHLNTEGQLAVDDLAVCPVEGVVRGEIKNIEQVSQSIKAAVDQIEERQGIKITDVCSGISGQHIKCAKNSCSVYVGRDGEIREDDVQKLYDNMRNVQASEGQRILDFIPQKYVVNKQEEVSNPVGMFGQTLEGTFNFVIGESAAVTRLEKAFAKLDINLAKLLISPLVSAEAVVLPDERELGVAVLDIGAGTTDICIYHDKIARHIGVVPMGADMINKDIRAFGILERHTERLKVEFGTADSSQASDEKYIKVPGRTPREPKEISFYNLSKIIEARLMDILDYAVAEIKWAGFEGKLAAGLVVTGGCSSMKGLEKMVKAHTGLDVRIAVPEVNLSPESLEKVSDPRFTTAVGLLLGALRKEDASPAPTQLRTPTVPGVRNTAVNRVQPAVAPQSTPESEKTEEETMTVGDLWPEETSRRKRKKEEAGEKGEGWLKKLKKKVDEIIDKDFVDNDIQI